MELGSAARAACLAGCLLFGLACRAQADSGTIYDIHLLYGANLLQGWPQGAGHGDKTAEIGFEFDVQPASWPVAPYVSASFGTNATFSSSYEYKLGARKYWNTGDIGRAYVGGGLALVRGSESGLFEALINETSLSSKLTPGPWVGGGYIFTIARHFDLGLNLDYGYAKGALKDSNGNTYDNVNLSGLHIDAVIGGHF